MQKLPIGIQFFDSLREGNFLYVDKTEQIYRLINTGTFVFLSRPRRFGKSLLVSTLQHLFQGRRELFRGLWIEDKIDWQPRPVLVINFNDLDYREQSLETALTRHMDRLAAEHQVELQSEHSKGKFQELIVRLSEKQKVVLLVDEYDRAITDLLENEQKVAEHVATLKNFYSVLKTTAANHIRWTFLTGIFWYNGFSWDGRQTLYVPFSTLVFFELQSFENHWFATATPSFLIKLLRQKQLPAYALERLRADNTLLDSADVNNINVISLLFQTGYLTVKRAHPSLRGKSYDLGYPNHEVAQAFQQYLLAEFVNVSTSQIGTLLLADLQEALEGNRLERFITILNAIFAGILYTLFLPEEAYYHSIVYLVLKLLGFSILAEPLTSQGRIDAVLELPDKIYILEFKMSSAQIALDRIRARGYAQPYRASGKPIALIGIAFDKERRAIGDWKSEPEEVRNDP